MKGLCTILGRAPRILLSFSPPFSLILLNLEGDQEWDKKGNQVLAREVNHKFDKGTWF